MLALCAALTRAEDFEGLLGAEQFGRLAEALRVGEFAPDAADRATFESRRVELVRQLDELRALVAARQERQRVAPAFKWGQNRTDVFLQVKLSHRFEAPGCLDVSSISAAVEGARLLFNAECVQAGSPLLFALDFELFAAATAHPLERESVGAYVLRLTKTEDTLWPDIFADFSARAAHRSHVWLELEREYPDDMADALLLMEDYLERRSKDKRT